jgi:UDP-N-acetylglucosamine 2-epimerase
MRTFREKMRPEYIRFYKNFPIETYVRLMLTCACVVGNSSAPIREGAFLGVPAVNIGSRQQGRARGANLVDVDHDRHEIAAAIRAQMEHGPYPSETIYGKGDAGQQIADLLATIPLEYEKRLTY